MCRWFGLALFRLTIVIACLLQAPVTVFAHFDGDVANERHFYAMTTWTNRKFHAKTPQDSADIWAIHYFGTTGAICNVYFDADEIWKIEYDQLNPHDCVGNTQIGNFSASEWHCDTTDTFTGDSYTSDCIPASHSCVGTETANLTIDVRNPWFGFNQPDDAALTPPFSNYGNNGDERCSWEQTSVSDLGSGYYRASYVGTGGRIIDEDGLLESQNEGNVYSNCIPNVWNPQTGEVINNWGQQGVCDESGDTEDPLGNPQPDSAGADNEGSDDSNPDASTNSGGSSNDNTNNTTNIDNIGVEERLDDVNEELNTISDEQAEQSSILGNIDSELDELDSNTERAANSLEDIDGRLEGIGDSLDELNDCDPAEELCSDSDLGTLPGEGTGVSTIAESNTAFYTAISTGPLATALGSQNYSINSTTCPTAEFDFQGQTFSLDYHCTVLANTDITSAIGTLMLFFWSFAAIRIFASA